MQNNRHLIFSSFILKIIAMIAVLSDHVAYAFLSSSSPLYIGMRIFGRLAFILFAFFLSEGIIYSRNKDAYLLRLLILYVIMQVLIVGVNLYDSSFEFSNVFFTLFAVGTFLVYFEKKKWSHVHYLVPLLTLLVINYLGVYQNISSLYIYTGDYHFYGIAVIIGFYLARKFASYLLNRYPLVSDLEDGDIEEDIRRKKQVIMNASSSVSLLLITFIWYILSVFNMSDIAMNMQSYAIITIPLLILYNGRLGHNGKTFRIVYYGFFPVHLILLALISLLI
ncbi:MAG: TraX family protein [Bacilli bacterium]|nr:TraX family protein [Bacilli bacterium]